EARALDVQEEIARRFGGSFDVALLLFHAPEEEAALEALARARAGLERLRERGAIAGWESPERYLPPRARQEAVQARLARVDPERVERTLRAALAAAGFRVERLEGALASLREELRPPLVTRATLVAAATAASLGVVFLIALAHFRRAREAALATAPVVLGLLFMLAIMKVAAIPVNFMNVVVFPMVIGIEDNAVHIVHRARERRAAR